MNVGTPRIVLAAILTCMACYPSVAFELADAPTKVPGNAAMLQGTYLGPSHKGFLGWTEIDTIKQSAYQVATIYQQTTSGNQLIIAMWKLPGLGSKLPKFIITDGVRIGRWADGQTSLPCWIKKTMHTVIAIGYYDRQNLPKVLAAWTLPSTGLLTRVDISQVECFVEEPD
jgi:hypothetical protein